MEHQWADRREWFRALAYLATIAALGLFYAAISYHSGQSFTWHNGGWYGELARSFHQGQVSLLSKPSPELLADSNPYRNSRDYPFKLDISYYHGKYYSYFGPTPVILFFYPWLLLTGQVLNQALCFWFISVEELIVFALFLAAVVRLYYSSSSIGLQVLILLIFGLGYAQGFSIHFITVHNLAQETALLLIMSMFYFLFLSLHVKSGPISLVIVAAMCWGAAVGSRPTILPYGLVFLPILYHLLKGRPLLHKAGVLFMVMLPPMLIGGLLAWYNEVRFGNPLDFGIAYQLENRPFTQEPYFRLQYFPTGLADILFMPPRPSTDFPFLFPDPPSHNFLNPRLASNKYLGVIFALPVLLYGLFPFGVHNHPLLHFFRKLLLFSGFVMLVVLSCYFGIYFRYFMDFLTPFFLLMTIGLLARAQRWPSSPYSRLRFSAAVVWTLYMGTGLSFIGEINGLHNFHTSAFASESELWLPDGEKTEPSTSLKN